MGAPWSSSILLLLQHIARDQNHEYICYCFISKGLEQPIRSKCRGELGSVQDQRGWQAGASVSSPTLKRKIPTKYLGPREQFCRGLGSSGLPWGHFSVTCGNAPLCSEYGAGNIFLEFFQNTQQVCGAKTMAPSGEARQPARASWVFTRWRQSVRKQSPSPGRLAARPNSGRQRRPQGLAWGLRLAAGQCVPCSWEAGASPTWPAPQDHAA